ncbi:hypothetical protein GO998_03710 [Ralstonia syzygii]|uniref:Transmembrane protein n=1 Tax=Ralstonia syzygii TaxID=28097 RepID=A0ABX7ZC07_9RALS|nr:hypothetical protein [Ralstonia syzygii]QUP52920.1 hypothetical protein GO998_03710 [Ralstonia syzygii]
MAMVRMFVSEWQAFADAVQASRRDVPTLAGVPGSAAGGRGTLAAQHARLQRKWMRKQMGLAVVAVGAMLLFLHGMVQLAA